MMCCVCVCTLYLSTGPWSVVAAIVPAVLAAAIVLAVPVIIFFGVLYWRRQKPNTDDVEGKSQGLPLECSFVITAEPT